MQMTTSWKEEGILEGMQQGMQQGEFALVIRLLVRKFGELPATVYDAVQALDISRLEDLGDALLDFTKREDLELWLKEH